jgi:FdhD protein
MTTDNLFEELEITRYNKSDGLQRIDDAIIRESSLRVFLNDREVAVLQALKHDLKELAVGFLYSEVFLDKIDDIKSVEISEGLDAVTVATYDQASPVDITSVRSVTSGCGRSMSFINPLQLTHFPFVQTQAILSAQWITDAMVKLTESSRLFQATGGVHTAALSDGNEIVYIADDIGRHNCVDKVIGWELLNNTVPRSNRVMLSSGRLCTAIVSKAIRGHLPFVISHSAPTIGAVQLAREFGITLVGFVRGARFNIYSHEERVVL